MKRVEIDVVEGGERLDVFLAHRLEGISRNQVQRLIEMGWVTVDGQPAKAGKLVRPGQRVAVVIPPPESPRLEPEPIPIPVLYEDGDVLVVDKPPGIPVHPGPGHPRGTLVNALLALYPQLKEVGQELRPGIVHRLDKDTSGLLLVAKTARAHRHLVEELKARRVHKVYIALVHGIPQPPQGVVMAPIARHPKDRKRMAVVEGGREAETRYRLKEAFQECALLEVEPVTGRTHQIRVHLAYIGHPVVGDPIYGHRSPLVARQFLHAHRLRLVLPSGEMREFISPLAPDLEAALAAVRAGARP